MTFDLSYSVDGVTVAVAGVETPSVAPESKLETFLKRSNSDISIE